MNKQKTKLERIWDIIREGEANTVKLEEMKLEDGVTIIEAEVFEPEYPVNVKTEDGQLIPLPAGEYVLEDGRILVVETEGVIKEIKEAEAQAEEPMEEEPVAAADKPNETPLPKSIIESVSKETKFSSDLEKEVADLKALVTELSAQLKGEEKAEEKVEEKEEVELAKPITYNPENKQEVVMKQFAKNRTPNTLDRVMQKLANKK